MQLAALAQSEQISEHVRLAALAERDQDAYDTLNPGGCSPGSEMSFGGAGSELSYGVGSGLDDFSDAQENTSRPETPPATTPDAFMDAGKRSPHRALQAAQEQPAKSQKPKNGF